MSGPVGDIVGTRVTETQESPHWWETGEKKRTRRENRFSYTSDKSNSLPRGTGVDLSCPVYPGALTVEGVLFYSLRSGAGTILWRD